MIDFQCPVVDVELESEGFATIDLEIPDFAEARPRVEEVDLRLPPKPQSQIVAEAAEAAAKKMEKKKKDVEMARDAKLCLLSCLLFWGAWTGFVDRSIAGFRREGPALSLRPAETATSRLTSLEQQAGGEVLLCQRLFCIVIVLFLKDC